MNTQLDGVDIVHLPSSASDKIDRRRSELRLRCDRDGIQSLSSHDWALLTLLNKAHRALRDGSGEFDAAAVGRKFVKSLRDEGTAKWRTAYAEALEEARSVYFTPHPDSK